MIHSNVTTCVSLNTRTVIGDCAFNDCFFYFNEEVNIGVVSKETRFPSNRNTDLLVGALIILSFGGFA